MQTKSVKCVIVHVVNTTYKQECVVLKLFALKTSDTCTNVYIICSCYLERMRKNMHCKCESKTVTLEKASKCYALSRFVGHSQCRVVTQDCLVSEREQG